jgi:hypothetical protein
MPPFGMLGRVTVVRTDVSEERIAYVVKVTRIGELGTTLVVTSNRSTLHIVPTSPILISLLMEGMRSFETSVFTRATQRNILEDDILHSYLRGKLKFYNIL